MPLPLLLAPPQPLAAVLLSARTHVAALCLTCRRHRHGPSSNQSTGCGTAAGRATIADLELT